MIGAVILFLKRGWFSFLDMLAPCIIALVLPFLAFLVSIYSNSFFSRVLSPEARLATWNRSLIEDNRR